MKRRTEITIETERVLVISKRNTSALAWCAGCQSQAQMITPDTAARLANMSSRTIYKLIEADELHFTETSDHHIWICITSLNHQIERATHLLPGQPD
jgi:hypothetical protein